MERKFKKQNGFPTRYAYACGYGVTFEQGNDRISIYENDSHTCFDVKGFIAGHRIWAQFFHIDGNSTKQAEKRFNHYKKAIKHNLVGF